MGYRYETLKFEKDQEAVIWSIMLFLHDTDEDKIPAIGSLATWSGVSSYVVSVEKTPDGPHGYYHIKAKTDGNMHVGQTQDRNSYTKFFWGTSAPAIGSIASWAPATSYVTKVTYVQVGDEQGFEVEAKKNSNVQGQLSDAGMTYSIKMFLSSPPVKGSVASWAPSSVIGQARVVDYEVLLVGDYSEYEIKAKTDSYISSTVSDDGVAYTKRMWLASEPAKGSSASWAPTTAVVTGYEVILVTSSYSFYEVKARTDGFLHITDTQERTVSTKFFWLSSPPAIGSIASWASGTAYITKVTRIAVGSYVGHELEAKTDSKVRKEKTDSGVVFTVRRFLSSEPVRGSLADWAPVDDILGAAYVLESDVLLAGTYNEYEIKAKTRSYTKADLSDSGIEYSVKLFSETAPLKGSLADWAPTEAYVTSYDVITGGQFNYYLVKAKTNGFLSIRANQERTTFQKIFWGAEAPAIGSLASWASAPAYVTKITYLNVGDSRSFEVEAMTDTNVRSDISDAGTVYSARKFLASAPAKGSIASWTPTTAYVTEVEALLVGDRTEYAIKAQTDGYLQSTLSDNGILHAKKIWLNVPPEKGSVASWAPATAYVTDYSVLIAGSYQLYEVRAKTDSYIKKSEEADGYHYEAMKFFADGDSSVPVVGSLASWAPTTAYIMKAESIRIGEFKGYRMEAKSINNYLTMDDHKGRWYSWRAFVPKDSVAALPRFGDLVDWAPLDGDGRKAYLFDKSNVDMLGDGSFYVTLKACEQDYLIGLEASL